jgi:hypothetical protein
MPDPPSPLPPIMQSRLLRVIRMGVNHDGLPFMVLVARYGSVRRLVVYLKTDQPAAWEYGYEIYDPQTRTKTSYIGPHGDPTLDEVADLEGVPGFDDE